MVENVFYLHGRPTAIGHFLRIGPSGHRQLETLLSSGKMMLNRVVVDAAAVGRQQDLIFSVAEAGGELILDTNVAELSSIGKFGGAVRSAPWANPKSVLTADDLRPNANRDVIGHIARFTVENAFHMVQAPTHFLDGSSDPLFSVDQDATKELRKKLDVSGGTHVGINYPLIIKASLLRDSLQRKKLVSGLRELPIDSIWLRISGFGADASPSALRGYITADMDFVSLGRPIVADGVGGIVGLALAAFGAAGGICHGAGEKERFDATDWNRPPQPDTTSFGRTKRVLIGAIDRSLTEKQIESIMAAPGARKILSCNDRACCAHGLEDMLGDPKAHYLYQRAVAVNDLSRIPDERRNQHFLDKVLAPAERSARMVAKLRVPDAEVRKMLEKSSERLDKMHLVLDDLNSTMEGAPRSLAPRRLSDVGLGSGAGRR